MVEEIRPRSNRSGISIRRKFDNNVQYSTELFHYSEIELFKKLNYQLYQIRGDGNCLFRALAHQLGHNQDYHSTLRNLITDNILNNSEEYLEFFIDNNELKSYVVKMKKIGEYGDGICIGIFCIMNNCKVTIYRSAINLDEPLVVGNGEKIFYLYYDERILHYSSLIKLIVC